MSFLRHKNSMRSIRHATRMVAAFACGLVIVGSIGFGNAQEIAADRDVMAPMRDGVKLAADLYIPPGEGPFPVVLIRTPYNKQSNESMARGLAKQGYVCVVQDCRGRFNSEGKWDPFTAEQTDGKDTTEWVKSQRWCNGTIGTLGGSYFGYTQWALAPGNPDVAALAIFFSISNLYDAFYRGGALYERTWLSWSLLNHSSRQTPGALLRIEDGHAHLPLVEKDNVVFRDVPFFNYWVTHPLPNEYWQGLSLTERISEISAPMLLVSGWYDLFTDEQLRDFMLVRQHGQPKVKADTKIIVGPWNHTMANPNQKNYGIVVPALYLTESLNQWFDYALKGEANGWQDRAPVRIFVLGENVWRDEQEWPLDRAVSTPYYLHSGGEANTSAGDGALSTRMPAAEAADMFSYDPQVPVPTVGGSNLGPQESGPADQQEVEARQDVLVYSTEPLAEPVEITGPAMLTLYASSDAPDTDFTGKLVDVFPDGRALILCEGILRARYRNGMDKAALLDPGEIYEFTISLGNTSVLFGAGHRIRLEVSSSNFPRYDRNPNTGTEIATETHTRVANQKIFHDAEHPSHLTLPVVPR